MVYKVDFDEIKKTLWGKRAEGLPIVGFDLSRDITPEELMFLHQKFSYIQIVNPLSLDDFSDIRFMRAPSGWLILNYKNAITVSPGEKLFTDAVYAMENGVPERVCTGVGTRIKQIVDTGTEAVRIAVEEQDWPQVHIVNGTSLMCWAVWKAAKDLGVEITGYAPSIEEEAKYERIKANCPSLVLAKTPTFPKG